MKAQIPSTEYKKLSDEELIYRFFHRHENKAIIYLYERYGHLVMGLCCKYLKGIEEAKHATRQIFFDLIKDLANKEIHNFKPWLFHYVREYCLNRTSQPKVDNSVKDKPTLDFENNLHQKVEEDKVLQKLDNEVSGLKEEVRTCLEMFYLQNMTFNQISSLTGKSLGEVKMNILTGKQDLKIKLELTGGVRL